MNPVTRTSQSQRVVAVAACTAAVVVAAFWSSATLDARSKKADVESTWRAGNTIVIDGVNEEWEGRLTPIKDVPASIGFFNDSDNLYFCLTSSDPALREQIKRRGLIVWIDPKGGKKKDFGVEFPVGLQGMTMVERTGETGEPSVSNKPLEADQERIVILGPGKNDRENLRLDEAHGIQAKIGESSGVMVYELEVPLRKTEEDSYAPGAAPGTMVGIGLETPEFQPEQGRSWSGGEGGGGHHGPGGGGGWGGGMGGHGGYGGRGGMGGGGEHGGGRGGFERPKQIKAWTTVQLAEGAR